MSIVSYAQNFEDVMLWRVMKNIPAGFYIDIGANDPDIESVTKLFYDNGWNGINVEPVYSHFLELQRKRPRDINVRAAIGSSSGSIEIWEPEVRGWATASADVISQHQKEGFSGRKQTVPMKTLTGLFEEHVNGDVHFLKVDVEGFEKAVLQGMDFSRFRPWVLVIEATEPNSPTENFADWENLVVNAGYRLVYRDGLNRFYLADEHSELEPAFRYPPNVFDDFEMADLVSARKALDESEARMAEIERLAEVNLQAERAHRQAMENSTSWKLTAPLRRISTAARAVYSEHIPRYTKQGLRRGIQYLHRYPALKKYALIVVNRMPAVRDRLLAVVNAAPPEDWHPVHRPTAGAAPHPWVLPVVPRVPEAMLLPLPDFASARWVRITGHVEGHYSLAIVNRGVATALEELTGSQLQLVPYHGQPYAQPPKLPGEQGSALLQHAMQRQIPADNAENALSIVHHYPFILDELPAAQKGMLFFWEETSVPAHIVDHMNRHMDLVWVSAEAVKRALINSGCRTPVFIIPLGIDHLIKPDIKPIEELSAGPGQCLRFLHLSSAFARKGADVLLEAYMEAFTGEDAVELYIKTFPNPHNQVRAHLNSLCAAHDHPPKVIIDESQLDDEELLSLYRSAHAMVLPTRGEGFNLPAAEAMAMGLPVITTGASAHVDFCTRDTATLVNFQYAPSDSHLKASDACWFEPNHDDLVVTMRQMARRIKTGDPHLQAQRQAAMHYVRDTYRWRNSAQSLLASADWLTKSGARFHDLSQIAVVTPWDTPCGIAEYSRNLLSSLCELPGLSVDIYCDDRTETGQTEEGVVVSWALGESKKLEATLERIAGTGAQAIVVQHQPSLFTLTDRLCQKLAELATQGRVVVLELHATAPLLAENSLSPKAVNDLSRIDRVVVHTPGDLNKLMSLGLADNVLLLEHGVIQPQKHPVGDPRTELGIPANALVLGSFGFALPHKGLDTLVETVTELQQAVVGRPVHLVAVNSVLDSRSERLLQRCRQQAKKAGVESQIHWVSDYQPIETCQHLLSAADYIIFPYRQTRESASGAVTIGLSALRPVLVSPLDIFSDLSGVTLRMSGSGSEHIVNAVTDLEASPERCQELIANQHAWLKARDWRVISARFATIVGALARERQLAATLAPARKQHREQWVNTRRRQLLVDVSELYYRNARTGIQRVVCNWLDELWRQAPTGYDIRPVYSADGEDFHHTCRFNPEGAPDHLDEQPVMPAPGDLFFGLDLAAHLFPRVEKRLQEYRLTGVKIVYMVYDILPLTAPEYFDQAITRAFRLWVQGLARQADQVIGISKATAEELKEWLLATEGFTSAQLPLITASHLGADFRPATVEEGESDIDSALLQRLAAETTFLMVGTIEPRKGHVEVLDAFEQLWREGQNINLVIVGKQGWKVERLVRRLCNHQQAGQRLFWLAGISDGYLEAVYSASTCLLAASFAEGFGLPLIEAAQRQLPVIARDIPVFREVAGNHVFYFDRGNGQSLAETIEAWLDLYSCQSHPVTDNLPWLTWKQSAGQLLKTLGLSSVDVKR